MPDRAQIAVWDLPIRLFHWTLAALIAFSWWTAATGHLEWHLYSGFGICSLILFRLLWGVFGSSTARFTNFVRGPRAVAAYLKDQSTWRLPGHSPLGALSVVALLVAVAVQVALGMFAQDNDGLVFGPLATFVSSDTSDRIREIHGIWFWVLIALIVLHIGAIVYYKFVGRQPLTKAMLTGTADLPDGTEPMRQGKYWVALICLVAGIALTRWIIAELPPFGG